MKANKDKGEKKYICTQCGGDASVAYSEGWNGLIKKGERICLFCGRKRGIDIFKMAPMKANKDKGTKKLN